mgnify:CR=1 FL=1
MTLMILVRVMVGYNVDSRKKVSAFCLTPDQNFDCCNYFSIALSHAKHFKSLQFFYVTVTNYSSFSIRMTIQDW